MAFLKIGTRGSPLALAQAHLTRGLLMQVHNQPLEAFEIKIIQTSGDIIQDKPLSEVGGKGLFTKEIETALLKGEIDIAVHSGKDMATTLPEGLMLFAALPREDVRDVFISRNNRPFKETVLNATIGTASLRRAAQVRLLRPDLQTINFRGNVQTRLKKLEAGDVAGTLLAFAGLKRLGLERLNYEILNVQEFLPAVAQGIIVIEGREEDTYTQKLLAPLNCQETRHALDTERAFLKLLDGSCRTPLAGLARIENNLIHFQGEAYKDKRFRVTLTGRDPVSLGLEAGERLCALLPDDFYR